jgi:hypothetical protein
MWFYDAVNCGLVKNIIKNVCWCKVLGTTDIDT